jgi:hypothetical protein
MKRSGQNYSPYNQFQKTAIIAFTAMGGVYLKSVVENLDAYIVNSAAKYGISQKYSSWWGIEYLAGVTAGSIVLIEACNTNSKLINILGNSLIGTINYVSFTVAKEKAEEYINIYGLNTNYYLTKTLSMGTGIIVGGVAFHVSDFLKVGEGVNLVATKVLAPITKFGIAQLESILKSSVTTMTAVISILSGHEAKAEQVDNFHCIDEDDLIISMGNSTDQVEIDSFYL